MYSIGRGLRQRGSTSTNQFLLPRAMGFEENIDIFGRAKELSLHCDNRIDYDDDGDIVSHTARAIRR